MSTKKKKYAAAYEKIVKEDIIFSDMDAAISLFEEQYGLSFADAKGAVTVLLLEKNITDYENTLRRADVPESFKKEMIQTIKDENGLVWNFYHGRKGVDGPRSSGARRVHFDVDGEPMLDFVEEKDLPESVRKVQVIYKPK